MADYRVPGVSSYSAQNPMNLGFSSRSAKTPQSLAESLVSSFTPEEALAMFEAREKDPSASFDQPTGQTLAEILGPPGEIPDISFLTELEGRVPAGRTPEYGAVAQREEMERLRAIAEAKDSLVRRFHPNLTEQERKDYEFSDYEKELMVELGISPGLWEGTKQVWDTFKGQGRRIQEAWREKVADVRSPTEADTAYVDYMRKAATGISSDRSVLPTIQQPRGGGAEKREGILEDLESSQQVNLTDPTKPSDYPEVVAMVDSYKARTPVERSAEFWQNFGLWMVPNVGVARAFAYAPKIASTATLFTKGVPKIIGRGAVGGVIDYNRAKFMGYSEDEAKLAGIIGGTMGVVGQAGSMFSRWLKRAPDDVADDLYTSVVHADNVATGNTRRVQGVETGNAKMAEEGRRIAETSERLSAGQAAREMGVNNPVVLKEVAENELTNVGEAATRLWARADELAPDIRMVDKIGDADAGAAWFHFNGLMERYARQTHRGASALKEAAKEETTALAEDAARAIPDVDPVIDAGRAVWAKVLAKIDPTKGVDDVLKALNDLLPSDWASIQKVLYRLRTFEGLRLEPAPEVSQVLTPVQNKIRDAFSAAFKGLDGLSREQASWTISFGNQADEATRFFRNPIDSIIEFTMGRRSPRTPSVQIGDPFRPQSSKAVPKFQPAGKRTGYFRGNTLGEQIRNATERQQALLEVKEAATMYVKQAAHQNPFASGMQWLTAGAAIFSGRPFLFWRATGAGFLPQFGKPGAIMRSADIRRTLGTQLDSPLALAGKTTGRAYMMSGINQPDFRDPTGTLSYVRSKMESSPIAQPGAGYYGLGVEGGDSEPGKGAFSAAAEKLDAGQTVATVPE